MKTKHYLLTFGFVLTSIVSTYFATVSTAQQSTQPAPVVTADNEYQVGAVLYMQTAAEYRALCYQAYNVAQMALDADFDKKNLKKLPKAQRKMPRAVMIDIDETILDNSPQQVDLIKRRAPFNLKDWYAWGERRSAKAIPGAVEFLNYANQKGVKIFYASNRDEVQKQATMDNLKSDGFPDVTAENVLLRQNDSSKEPRRQMIMQKYRIVLFAGDNLDDSSQVFEKKSVAERFAETDKARELFGRKYIVLPNPVYGTWENAIYDYGRLNEVQKSEKRLNALQLP
ncbi:MAG: 5'-nucleotidase, lipoprotein e(P4) family [Pyrinomonadaceae bacterium]